MKNQIATTQTARLIFADGTTFYGKVFAQGKAVVGEVVFNTAMVGYQEVLTDPSYRGQMVVMTYPMMGNYGINEEDTESNQIHVKALLVKEYIDFPSNWRSTTTLKQYLEDQQILGIEGLDTRAITKYLREQGATKAILTTSSTSGAELLEELVATNLVEEVVEEVSCTTAYVSETTNDALPTSLNTALPFKVAVIDGGVKQNILRLLEQYGCACTVFPYTVSAQELLTGDFDGVLLSNGPGNPAILDNVVQEVRQLIGKLPIFGICLGHQVLGLALGASIKKLKFGHHGINHPIKNLKTGSVEITSQNHNFVIAPDSIDSTVVAVTHMNLLDNTIAGIRHQHAPAFSVQYHPEAAPGPLDAHYLFDEFVQMMETVSSECVGVK